MQVNTHLHKYCKIEMKNILLILWLIPTISSAQSMQTLFDSLKVNPQNTSNRIIIQRANLNKELSNSLLFPKINGFGKYDYASSPIGMIPVAPNELIGMVKDSSVAQPFSQNTFRLGIGFSMPIYVKSIYTMAAKAKAMYQSAEIKAVIDLLKNEAVLVSSNANLIYIESLDKALRKKKESLETIKQIIEIKVKNGRAPESALLKIKSGINNIELKRSQIAINREQILTKIHVLTGLRLKSAVAMLQTNTYKSGEIKVLKPMLKNIEATKLGVRAEKEKLYPALVLNGNYNHAYAKAYNNNIGVNTDYTTVGVVLRIPIFEKGQYKKLQIEKLKVVEQENELEKMRLEYSAQAIQLENSLEIIINSEQLYKQSIAGKEELLNIAKVGYKSDRMSIEDYLKYEDDLLLEKSNLYKIEVQKWQTLMQLAVIYGNNIEEIVK